MGYPSTPPTPHASVSRLILLRTIRWPSHQIESMGMMTNPKHWNIIKNIYSNNIYSCSYFTQNRIRINLGNISFIFISKALHFEHAKFWWIRIKTKICYLLILQVNLSSITLTIYFCIWTLFGRKRWIILFFFNCHFLWYPCGLVHHLWHWMRWFRNPLDFSFLNFFWIYDSLYFKTIIPRKELLTTLC